MGECADMANTSEETGKNLREQVYTRLRNSILEGEYHGNQQLRESELTERYGVSRSPVREALKQLVGDGLAYNIPNRGVFVRQITEADVESIFDIRILVERYALQKMIVNLDEQSAQELCRVRDELMACSGDRNAYIELDAKLHNLFVELSGNPILLEINDKVYSLLQPFRMLALQDDTRFEESLDEHNGIVDSVLERDFRAAWKWDSVHLNKAKKEMRRQLQRMGSID